MSRAVIALAAGGTGGHMFPAEALARALIGRGLKIAMVTDSRGGAFGESSSDIEIYRIRAATVGAGLGGLPIWFQGLDLATGGWSDGLALVVN